MAVRPETPVVISTGYSAQINREKALGKRGYCQKPLTIKSLLSVVREVLGKE